jgi:hypothetical protein
MVRQVVAKLNHLLLDNRIPLQRTTFASDPGIVSFTKQMQEPLFRLWVEAVAVVVTREVKIRQTQQSEFEGSRYRCVSHPAERFRRMIWERAIGGQRLLTFDSLYGKVMSSRMQLRFWTGSYDLNCSCAQDCDLGGSVQRMRDMRQFLSNEDTQNERPHDEEGRLPA